MGRQYANLRTANRATPKGEVAAQVVARQHHHGEAMGGNMRTSIPLTEQQRKAMLPYKEKVGELLGTIQSIGLVQGQHTE